MGDCHLPDGLLFIYNPCLDTDPNAYSSNEIIPAATADSAIIGARPRDVPVEVINWRVALDIGVQVVSFAPSAFTKVCSDEWVYDAPIIGYTIAIAITDIIKIRIAAKMKSTPIMAFSSFLNFNP